MNDTQILMPMLGVMTLTAVVWFVLYARRLPAIAKAGKPAQAFTTPDKGAALLPDDVNYPAYNFRNLFELPVLFYALCLYLYVTGSAEQADVIAAWVFCAFRVAHSAIHCTVNIVKARFATYVVSTFALWFMLARAVLGAAGA